MVIHIRGNMDIQQTNETMLNFTRNLRNANSNNNEIPY